MATFAETQKVIARTCKWVKERPRRAKTVSSDLDVIVLMAELNLSQASAVSPIGRFMVRAALRIAHNEERPPLKLLALFRAGMDDSDPVHTGLKDLRLVTQGDAGGRVLHRLVHQAGQDGCNLYQLGKILHCLADEWGPDERPEDAQAYLFDLLGYAYQRRQWANEAAKR